jgi:hypothetical protein
LYEAEQWCWNDLYIHLYEAEHWCWNHLYRHLYEAEQWCCTDICNSSLDLRTTRGTLNTLLYLRKARLSRGGLTSVLFVVSSKSCHFNPGESTVSAPWTVG